MSQVSPSMTRQFRIGTQDGVTGMGFWHQVTQHYEICFPPHYKPEHPSPLPDPWTGCHRVCKNLWDSPTVGSQLHLRYWFILYPLDNFNHNANRGKHHHLPCHLDFKLHKNNHSKPSPGTVAGSNCFVTAALAFHSLFHLTPTPRVAGSAENHWPPLNQVIVAGSVALALSALILSSALLLLKLP